MPPTRAIFLDAGNTLFTERRPRAAIYSTVARSHGSRANEDDAADLMGRAFAEIPFSAEGNFRYSTAWFETFNEIVLREMGVSESRWESAHKELIERFESPKTYKLFKETEAVLRELSNLGLTLGVVSNWSERLPVLLGALGISDKFDFIVTSAEMRAEKPNRSIFERALFRAGVPADEVLHVGDHFERDVRGAQSSGIRAAHLDRMAEGAGITKEGVPVIADLGGILSLVEQTSHASRS
ncbi:MAG: HAD-IA family hydrolase [Planctomycetota bacterium]|jgi:putative hydrolase of the HAD superfamily|nr:HAD-IA family hydrolase [Planctomycetota bacterium]